VLELGRYLVGEAGYFVTRVIAVKESRGRRIAICDGGMNSHLPAAGHFGMVVPRNYRMHRVAGDMPEGAVEEVDLAGPLCTSIDKIGRGVSLPRLAPGDLVAVHCSGAYGPTASPLGFISHSPPVEVLAGAAGLVGTGPASIRVDLPR
jgi:diaminopimelate decarboxylase